MMDETEIDEYGTVWTRPTAHAYRVACVALAKTHAEVERLRNAIKQVFGPNGCGCVKDLPGDNSTCGAHRILFDVAQEPEP